MILRTKKSFQKFFDLDSIQFKLGLTLVAFTIFVVGLVWLLQILFLRNYYEDMRHSEISRAATHIRSEYLSSREEGWAIAESIIGSSDVEIAFEDSKGVVLSPNGTETLTIRANSAKFKNIKSELEKSGLRELVYTSGNSDKFKTMVAAYYIRNYKSDKDDILYVIAPLYPVNSTIDILAKQLMYVTFVTIIGSIIVSYFVTRKTLAPIEQITKDAMRMSEGDYNVKFVGGGYREIGELAKALNTTVTELHKADKYKRDLIANVSHDLKTPLTMVKSYAELIRDISGDKPEKRNDHLNIIIQEAERLNTLVTDMLDLSAIHLSKAKLHEEVFNLKTAVEALKPQCDLLEVKENYNFRWQLEDAYVRGDKSKIKRAMNNLITNAIKYCGNDKFVEIAVQKIDGRARFQVTDHGKGIPKEDIEAVWNRFFKSSIHHVRPDIGTGLGLPIVKEIIDLHKGKSGVESQMDKGSTFWFELKLAKQKK